MKRVFIAVALAASCVGAFAQGKVTMASQAPGVNATVTDATGTALPAPVSNGAYSVQLWGAVTPDLLTTQPLGSLIPITGVLDFVNSFAIPGVFLLGEQTTTIPGGPATLQVRVWKDSDGASWAAALNIAGSPMGQSGLFNVGLTTGTTTGANLVGLNNFQLVPNPVPEPSVIALGVLGAMALLFRRRK